MMGNMGVAEPEDIGARRLWRWLRLAGLALATIFLFGIAAGFSAAHFERHDGISTRFVAILGAVALAIIGCGWLLVRELRASTGEEPLLPGERMNRNILFGSGILGGVIAIVLMLAGGGPAEGGGILSNEPLPSGVALMLVLVIGLVLPAISIYWQRIVDEQEADAYKTGALYGLYVYMIGAPVWWLLWRGGLAPAPNGFLIYFATIFVVGGVWVWKKYR